MSAPLLLLDVDGVLNALGKPDRGDVWPSWRRGRATAEGRSFPILWAPAVVERLLGWHEAGDVELQWLTTWGHEANDELRVLLGLPALQVAGTYREVPATGASLADTASHAGTAPSAPLGEQWWKHDVVVRLLSEQPGRRLLWVDDELHGRTGTFRRWAEAHPDVVPVGPDPRLGLTRQDLDRIAAHL